MSAENLRAILKRAATEPGFRARLFANPVLATTEYSLSAEELKTLIHLKPETLDAMAADLDPTWHERGGRELGKN
jgi:hypothetical protein